MMNIDVLQKVKDTVQERYDQLETFQNDPDSIEKTLSLLKETELDWYKHEYIYLLNLIYTTIDFPEIINMLNMNNDIITVEPKVEEPQEKEEKLKNIILYKNVMTPYAWSQYTKILNFDPALTSQIKIYVKKAE